jgi:HEAT repeat protein
MQKDATPHATLSPEDAAELMEFARACRAALHAVALYPGKHPAIERSLARITEVCRVATRQKSLQLAVLPTDLVLNGGRLARPDLAASEVGALLHAHLVGQILIHEGTDVAVWHRFLSLVARPPEDVRSEGGIARAWATAGAQHIEIREIDYAELLRERPGGDVVTWDSIVSSCLRGDAVDLDDRALRTFMEIAGDEGRLAEFARKVESQAASGGSTRSCAAVLLHMLNGIVGAIGTTAPAKVDAVYRNMAGVVGQLPSEGMLQWLVACADEAKTQGTVSAASEVVSRLDDDGIAEFMAASILATRGGTPRLAEAFRAFAPDSNRRRRLLGLAEQRVRESPLGREESSDRLWRQAEAMLSSYSDRKFVSEEYGQELDRAPARAADVEHMSEDPPERLAAWLGSLSDSSLRTLDVQLLVDLLGVEADPFRWRDVTRMVAAQIEDLILVGDFRTAVRLLEALTKEIPGRDTVDCRQAISAAIERLVAGQVVLHIVYHLQSVSEEEFEDAKRVCGLLGPPIVKPLAEALAVDERARVRQRLTAILVGFGALGREAVEQLIHSANPSVRRTAVYLLREFGGSGALPDLAALINDSEPHVQREAVRAILTIGTDGAYEVLQRAFLSGTERSHTALLQHLETASEERVAPLLCYILRHIDHRGRLRSVYLKAISTLGAVGGPEAVDVLRDVLYRREWWAPFKNAAVRSAAADALRQTGDARASDVLHEAAGRGSFGVRSAAKAALALRAPLRNPRRR